MIKRGPIPEDNFTILNNDLLNDADLDWDELGVLVYLLSKPQDWKVSAAALSRLRKSGKDKIARILRTLRAKGYAVYVPSHLGGGDYIIQSCGLPAETGKAATGKAVNGKSGCLQSNEVLQSTDTPLNPPTGGNGQQRKRKRTRPPTDPDLVMAWAQEHGYPLPRPGEELRHWKQRIQI